MKLKLSILTDETIVNKKGEEEQVCLACHCWTCGYRSRTLWTILADHFGRELLLEFRDRVLPDAMKARRFFDDVEHVKERLRLPDDFRLLCVGTTDPDALAVKRYLLVDRGLDMGDLWRYRIGVSNDPRWVRRAIIPSFDAQGEVNHFIARAIDRGRKPRYDAPDGDRDKVIFNEINVDWKRSVTLCEGVFDMFKAGDNAVPLLGSDLRVGSALFNCIVANSTPVFLALDADMRESKVPLIAKRLEEYAVDVSIVYVPDDPGAMSKSDFMVAKSNAAKFDWMQDIKARLERAAQVHLGSTVPFLYSSNKRSTVNRRTDA
jgi:hypothetical protein